MNNRPSPRLSRGRGFLPGARNKDQPYSLLCSQQLTVDNDKDQ